MNKVLTWVAIFAITVGFWLGSGQLSFAETDSCMVKEIKGTVMVVRAGGVKEFKAFQNMRLSEGDTVRTGHSSQVVIEVDAEQSFKISANSEVVVSELKNKTGQTRLTLNLRKGGVGSDVNKKLPEGSDYKIKTPTAVMGVRGTEFFVQFESGETDVWLTKGVVTMDYRRRGNTALPFSSTEGVQERVILRAPAKAILDATHALPENVVQTYTSDGLYEEFLNDLMEDAEDYDDFLEELQELREKYHKSIEIRDAKEAKEDEEQEIDDDVVHYENPSISDEDDDRDTDNDDDGADEDTDDEQSGSGAVIPPKPVGSYVYIRRVQFHGAVETIESWIPYEVTPDPNKVVFVILGEPVFYSKSEMEANDFILDMIQIP